MDGRRERTWSRAVLVASGRGGMAHGCRSPSRNHLVRYLSRPAPDRVRRLVPHVRRPALLVSGPNEILRRQDKPRGITDRRPSGVLRDRLRKRSRRRLSAQALPRNECPTVPPGNTFRTSPSWCIAQTVMDCRLGIGPRGVHRESVPGGNIGPLVRALARRGPGLRAAPCSRPGLRGPGPAGWRRRGARPAVGLGAAVVAGAAPCSRPGHRERRLAGPTGS